MQRHLATLSQHQPLVRAFVADLPSFAMAGLARLNKRRRQAPEAAPLPAYVGNLHRARVSSRQRDREATVFFESVHRDRADVLRDLMVRVWRVPADDLVVENIWSADELLTRGFSDSESGDLRLFASGWDPAEGVLYTDPSETLILVASQALHDRLHSAQLLIPQRTRIEGVAA